MPLPNRIGSAPHPLLFLVGPRASGKTHVACDLAARLHGVFEDTDERLGRLLATSIADYVRQNGWTAFREREKETLASLIREYQGPRPKPVFVATGGGIVLDPSNTNLMRSHGVVVYLRVREEVLVQRLTRTPVTEQRPSLTGLSLAEEVHRVLEERNSLYESCADLVVNGEPSVAEVVDEILEKISC